MWRCVMRVAVSVLLCAGLVSDLRAELASVSEMDNVARNWVTEMTTKQGTWAGVTNPDVVGVQELSQDGLLLARIYNLSPRGYVVVPALKELGPIRVYSDKSNLDADQAGGMIQLLTEVLAERMALYISVYGDLNALQPAAGEVLFGRDQKTAWERLTVATKDFRLDQSSSILAEGGPLLTSSWHQRAPYNNSCPMGDGGRCVVGCTATSLSQILDYWQWPASGVGNHAYYWGGDNCRGGWVPGYEIFADFSDGYDWANIPDSCDGLEGCTEDQEIALAELCHEAGVSVNMNYSNCGSGASMDMGVFPAYFKYSAGVSREYRSDHTQQSWFDLIKTEVDAGRVMWYGINSHAIVCDGYRDNGEQLEYHMNYGWGQANNAWYVLDDLYCYWILPDSVCPYEQDLVTINIEPQYTPDMRYIGRTLGDQGDLDGLIEAGEAATVSVTIQNRGNIAANSVGTLGAVDPFVQITSPSASFNPSFGWGEQSQSLTPFVIAVLPGCPDPHVAQMNLQIVADGGYVENMSIPIFIGTQSGWSDNMEGGEGSWTHAPIRMGYKDEWHLESLHFHSGTSSWKAGGAGIDNYSDCSDGGLVTPPFLLPADGKLKFWHWIYAEDDVNMTAWDGGIVMISNGDGNWTQIHPEGGYPYTVIDNDASPFAAGTPCFSGNHDWSEVTFDLSAYSGIVLFMFQFGADGAVNFEGWCIDDIWVGNTIEGANVQVNALPDLSVTFGTVLARGTTGATVTTVGPVPPEGYASVPSDQAQYYDVSTNAAYSGQVEVCITYDQADVTRPESELKLFHYETGSWVDITASVNPETNQICGSASSLSQFMIAQPLSCCVGRVGDANGQGTYPDEITLGDIMLLVDVKFISEDCGKIPCLTEADVNQDGGIFPNCDDHVTLGDIMYLVDFLFITGPEVASLPSCL